MKTNKEYIEEDNINRIRAILESDTLKSLIKEGSRVDNDPIISGDDIPDLVEETFPGLLNIRLDAMKMTLYLDLRAPINSSNEITLEDIKIQIELLDPKCESAVDWELIRDIYTRVMFEGEIVPETIIARGKPCSFHVPEHIIIKGGLISDSKPSETAGERVDYHKIRSFITVQKGEQLGDIIPEIPGVDGENLLGNKIPALKKVVNNLRAGKNVIIGNSRIYSEINGAFKIVDDKIIVDEVLDIKTDVDYNTGNITFEGDVVVNQSIREGFSVECNRDLFVTDSIEPSNIISGNNINVKHGILGSDKYQIEADGEINALHAENAKIAAKGSVYIEHGIMNCKINTNDMLITGNKFSIVGGYYRAQNGIICGNVGNKKGKETYLYLGTDYQIEHKLEVVQKTVVSIVEQMNNLQNLLISMETREKRDMMKFMFLKLKSKLNHLNNYSRSLLSKLDKNDKSSLIVHGTIYPGTYLEICHISYIVDRELTNVRFSLNKTKGLIEITYP